MVITERQVMELLDISLYYAAYLRNEKKDNNLTKRGRNYLIGINSLIEEIKNQQSTELKEIK